MIRSPAAVPKGRAAARWTSFVLPIALVACLFAVIVVTELGYLTRTTREVHEEMQQHLQINARTVDRKIEDLFASIEAVAPTMAAEAGCTREQMLLSMNALRDAQGFDFVVRTNPDGSALNYLGKDVDLSDRDYIREALGGARAVGFISSGAYDTGNAFVALAVPVRFEGKVVAVLHGSYKAANFITLLTELDEREGRDAVSVIASDGTVIASSEQTVDGPGFAALYARLSSDGDAGGSCFDDKLEGERRHYYFHPLAAKDGWFIVSRLDRNYLNERTSYARVSALVLLLTALGLAALLACVVVKRQRLLAEQSRRTTLLKDALSDAESAGEAKSRFLSNVSHEMRTPLNAIIGFIELAKGADERQMQTYLANMDIASKQLLSVINDVLDMSAIESGKMKISQAPFDFKRLIHGVTNLYVAQCNDKGVAYETRLLTPVDEWLVGDQLRVNQILMNLLGNAVKFTSEGHVWLSISQTEKSGGRLFLRFEVSDTGCGMGEELQQRLFKPFEQGSSETALRFGGSGLGLSIVKNLVGLLDGAISVKSEPGKGSTFTVELPFSRGEKRADLDVTGIETLNVLAVDDVATEREYIAEVLKRIGVRYRCVASGDRAMRALEHAAEAHDPFNVCLLDWRMPSMNGEDTTRRIRERYGKDVIVIVVSAYDHNQVGESAKQAGANLFIPKPLFQSSLFDLFMTLTGGRVTPMAEAAAPHSFAGRRVLLAEDNRMNQIVTKALLDKINVSCELAGDGRVATEMFASAAPGYYDAILMDIQMPVMDGLEAARVIRESNHPEARSVQIVALTANALNEDIARVLSAGMNAHISKPIEIDEMVKTLGEAFRRRDEEDAQEE